MDTLHLIYTHNKYKIFESSHLPMHHINIYDDAEEEYIVCLGQ